MTNLLSFGGRLRDARKQARLSAAWMTDYLNGYLIARQLKTIDVQTYYSWERIGTAREKSGRRYPHPELYRVMLYPLGVTGYWLFYGSEGGTVIRHRKDIGQLGSLTVAAEQKAAVSQNDELRKEFNRVADKLTPATRSALLQLLKSIR